MMVRALRAALFVAALCPIGLAAAAPAQAAPARQATPTAQAAQITIGSFYAVSAQEIEVHGTVTCSQPTGYAHVTSTVVQVMPFRLGGDTVDVPCASGPVSWQVTAFSYEGWDSFRQVTVNAVMTDDHGGDATTSVNGWA